MVVPAGLIMWSPAAGDFGQFLLCDGRSLSSSDYRDLYLICSYQFGGAAEAFNIPDVRGRWITHPGTTGAGNLTYVGQSSPTTQGYLDANGRVTTVGGGITQQHPNISQFTQGQGENLARPSTVQHYTPASIALNAFISGSREDLLRVRATQQVV